MSILSVHNMSVALGGVTILDKVDFDLAPREFVAIVGRSGAGKSTFLKAVAGYVPFDGEIIMGVEAPSFVFQNYAIFPWMTVSENIAFGLRSSSCPDAQKKVDELLECIEMKESKDAYPSELSGGQVQRVAIARAIISNPKLILMDEPFGSLDHHIREVMQEWLLSTLHATDCSTLFVTHDIDEAIFLADRIVLMDRKKFVAEVRSPFSQPRSEAMRLDPRLLETKAKIISAMKGKRSED